MQGFILVFLRQAGMFGIICYVQGNDSLKGGLTHSPKGGEAYSDTRAPVVDWQINVCIWHVSARIADLFRQ
jgi:hypothetical protein